MKNLFFHILSLCLAVTAQAKTCKPIVIAVLDSGFGYNGKGSSEHLCRFGHKDFSIDKRFADMLEVKDLVPLDRDSHGTNIVGIIEDQLSGSDIGYCIVVLKYFSEEQSWQQNVSALIKAINFASNIHANYINISGGGQGFNYKEKEAVVKFLNKGGIFVAAAMNENKNVDIPENAPYPASYDPRIIVVGNLRRDGEKSATSNYGKTVKYWEVGEDVTAYGIIMSGTSQATAVKTGKMVANDSKSCNSR